MFSQYFGHYLLNKGLIKPDQLADALEYQRSVHLKLGVLAVNAGFMTPSQVSAVHDRQKKVDKKFGELAIDLGFITGEQLQVLLSTQKQGHLLLGQALLDRNHFTMEQLQAALESYKKEQGLSERQFNVMQQDDVDEIVRAFFNFGEAVLGKVYSDYAILMIKNIIRFIDDNPRVEISQLTGDYTTDWFVSQEITGKINMLTGIACDNNALLELAGRFAGENISEANELALASAGEFLNLHNGIFLVNMSNNGIELDMKPQTVCKGYKPDSINKIYIAGIYLSWGKLDVIIS